MAKVKQINFSKKGRIVVKTLITAPVGRLLLTWRRKRLESLTLPPFPPRMKRWSDSLRTNGDWRRILGLEGIRLEQGKWSAFQRSVWSAVRSIPWGQTRSYVWVARRVGRPGAYRAVGNALKSNPWPLLIPCHRVVKSDGSLGGFGSGLHWKRFLLDLERNAGNGYSFSSVKLIEVVDSLL